MSNDSNATCEYEVQVDHDRFAECGRRATWSTDIGGGCSYWCDEHKRDVQLENELDRGDEPAVEFHRLAEGGGR